MINTIELELKRACQVRKAYKTTINTLENFQGKNYNKLGAKNKAVVDEAFIKDKDLLIFDHLCGSLTPPFVPDFSNIDLTCMKVKLKDIESYIIDLDNLSTCELELSQLVKEKQIIKELANKQRNFRSKFPSLNLFLFDFFK